jgi:dissimilatory sulfite reductase (desulfoviridin) alpha/beta subunit
MQNKETGFTLEMPKVGVIKGVLAKDIEVVGEKVVNLRTCARPYRNLYSVAQLRTIKNVIEKYGSGKVHLSPRHNLEIPEVKQKKLDDALKELYIAGLFPGGAGSSVRNIFTCPEWCSKSLRPVQELGKMVSLNFGDRDMPNKITISFAGCSNGCSRPHNSDIGIIAVGKVEVSDKKCPDECSDCIKACRFQAIEKANGNIRISSERCVDCCKCVEVCGEDILEIKETGFKVLVGGKEGSTVLFGKEYASFIKDFDVFEIIDRVLNNYQKKAMLRQGSTRKKERLGEVIERVGLEAFME